MKAFNSIKIKAALLLVVFSLNTIVGFACSIGVDKVFAASDPHKEKGTKAVVHIHAGGKRHVHHEKEETKASVHIHTDGKKHVHNKKEEIKPKVHVHADGKKHVHHEKITKQEYNKPEKQVDIAGQNNSKEDTNKCCTTKVTLFEQLDKYVSQSFKFEPIFFATLLIGYFNIDVLYTSYINTNIKYFVRSYHPPIPNIRIAIRSFQI